MQNLINKKPKAVLLDWDNTLANSWKIIHKCLAEAFISQGHEPWTLEEVIAGRDGIHQSLRQSFPIIFGEKNWETAAESYFKAFRACHLDEIELLEGANKTIEKLAQGDHYLAIVSNKTGQYLREELDKLEISHHFDIIIGAKDVEREKPHPDQIFHAIESAGLCKDTDKNDIWMVGDPLYFVNSSSTIFLRTVLLKKTESISMFETPR